jgi:hypothetical protein
LNEDSTGFPGTDNKYPLHLYSFGCEVSTLGIAKPSIKRG